MKQGMLLADTWRLRLTLMAVGVGLCLTGVSRWPAELRSQVTSYLWNLLTGYLPHLCW